MTLDALYRCRTCFAEHISPACPHERETHGRHGFNTAPPLQGRERLITRTLPEHCYQCCPDRKETR